MKVDIVIDKTQKGKILITAEIKNDGNLDIESILPLAKNLLSGLTSNNSKPKTYTTKSIPASKKKK